jgi:hypothetical protein
MKYSRSDRHSAAWWIVEAAGWQVRAIVFPSPAVMAGLVPAIHAGPNVRALKSWHQRHRVDARDKPVHDVSCNGVKP